MKPNATSSLCGCSTTSIGDSVAQSVAIDSRIPITCHWIKASPVWTGEKCYGIGGNGFALIYDSTDAHGVKFCRQQHTDGFDIAYWVDDSAGETITADDALVNPALAAYVGFTNVKRRPIKRVEFKVGSSTTTYEWDTEAGRLVKASGSTAGCTALDLGARGQYAVRLWPTTSAPTALYLTFFLGPHGSACGGFQMWINSSGSQVKTNGTGIPIAPLFTFYPEPPTPPLATGEFNRWTLERSTSSFTDNWTYRHRFCVYQKPSGLENYMVLTFGGGDHPTFDNTYAHGGTFSPAPSSLPGAHFVYATQWGIESRLPDLWVRPSFSGVTFFPSTDQRHINA